ncbi:MAG: peptidylprolyl isomerase [Chloroflexota bacterium]|nr:peptidylprolyl isomerase [Chloroflexota bacterium]
MRLAAAFAAIVVIATACGGAAAPATATQVLRTTPPVTRTATPTPLCPGAPNQASTKATITLEKGGSIVIQLRPDKAPKTVSIFALKAKSGFYDGLTFHRVVAGFVVQGGDPKGDGTGGGNQCTELSDLPFIKGAVGIARGNDINISNDSQFFVCIGNCLNLNGAYTNFGQVISGQDVADNVKIGDKIKTITVE